MKITNKISNQIGLLGIKSLNRLNLPSSLLIIPDGNRRWARSQGLQVKDGHMAGGDTVVKMLTAFKDLNIKIIGIWAFSEDNWKREKPEIDNIMQVVEEVIKKTLPAMQKDGIKFIVLGKKDRIKQEYPNLFKVLENAQTKTAHNNNKTFVIFLDYGERYQLEEFAKARASDKSSDSYQLLAKINNGLPLFDMVFRTSGELRLSGFGPLASTAELVVVKKNLPEITNTDIVLAFKEYSGRKRRLGGN